MDWAYLSIDCEKYCVFDVFVLSAVLPVFDFV
jgi:hypothetical protein